MSPTCLDQNVLYVSLIFKAFPVSLYLVASASIFSIGKQCCHEDLFKVCAEHVAFGEIVVPGARTPWSLVVHDESGEVLPSFMRIFAILFCAPLIKQILG